LCSIVFARAVPSQDVCSQGNFFVWVKKSTDVVVGSTCPPKFCPSNIETTVIVHTDSINSSLYLFCCIVQYHRHTHVLETLFCYGV